MDAQRGHYMNQEREARGGYTTVPDERTGALMPMLAALALFVPLSFAFVCVSMFECGWRMIK